jgi:DNA-binding transcriptional ArsR family regulator
MELLRDHGVRTAGDISDAFPDISRPAVSRHLRVLRESGIVVATQVGREWRYALDAAVLARTYRDWFERFVPLWEESLERLKRQVESDEGANDG